MANKMWKIAAEVKGVLFDDFKEKSLVAIGWDRFGDLSEFKSRETLIKAVQDKYPEYKKQKAVIVAGMLYRFAIEIKDGDRMVTYDPTRRVYLVGKVKDGYDYDPTCAFDVDLDDRWPHLRKVDWEGEVSRDDLSTSTKNTLGAIMTLFQVSKEAAKEIEMVLKGQPLPDVVERKDDQESEEEDLLRDIQARSVEFIKDKVSQLDWSQMQELVAGLLRAMGYKTRVSPAGPDRGKDVVASPDGFGFESPRIVVEVKHRTGSQMGASDIRSFIGGRHQDDKGLYVSTGGFSKEAYYEAERSNIPLTLMNIDELVKAVIEYYEKMDIETQRLIPLKKLYWPA